MNRSRKQKKVLGYVQRLETANVQGFHALFHERDLAPLSQPLLHCFYAIVFHPRR